MSENKSQKIIEVDGWRVYDFPIQYSEADYDEARAEVIKKLRQIPELAALFEFGYIPAPGISDIDLRAIFADDAEKMYIPREPAFSEKTKYLMMHGILLSSEKHYRKYLYGDPWATNVWPNGHKLLYQRDDIKRDLNFERINFNEEEKQALGAGRFEGALEEIYSLIPFYARHELPVREILESLKSCVYLIREINLINDRKIDEAFSRDFESLRSVWFSLNREEGVRWLIALFQQGLLIGFEAAFSFGRWLDRRSQLKTVKDLKIRKTNLRNGSHLDKRAKNIYLNTFGERQVFSDAVKTPKQALELSANSCQQFKIGFGPISRVIDFYILFQPLEMASILLGLADEKGLLSGHLRKDIFTNQKSVSVYKPEILQERNKMINDITEVYNKKQVRGLGCKGWLYGNSRFGYLFEYENLKRKFVNFHLKRNFWRTINRLS